MIKSEIYAAITEKIVANFENCGSWQQMWRTVAPVSLNGHIYRGINRLVLANDQFQSKVYGTFQQIRANGGSVRKGEKSTIVVFWKKLLLTDAVTLETKTKFMLRYYWVFNSEQAHFDEIGKQKIAKMNLEAPNHQIMEAEQIVIGYRDKPQIISESSCSCPAYYPGTDKIKMPPMSWFDSSEAYYRALYHEMTHSTLHEHRLNRQEGKEGKFGDEKYAMEELIAELGSAFLSNIAGFPDLRNSAAYISGWASALKENQKMIILAASRAEKAAEYILGKPTFTIEEEIPEHAEPELVNA